MTRIGKFYLRRSGYPENRRMICRVIEGGILIDAHFVFYESDWAWHRV